MSLFPDLQRCWNMLSLFQLLSKVVVYSGYVYRYYRDLNISTSIEMVSLSLEKDFLYCTQVGAWFSFKAHLKYNVEL